MLILVLALSNSTIAEMDFSNMSDSELQELIDSATTEMERRKGTNPSDQNGMIIDNDTVSVELMELQEQDDIGVFLVNLLVTNKTGQPIWVYLTDASINNEMLQMVMSGVPLYIKPGKAGNNSFIFSFSQVSINSFDEVNSVSFKVNVDNSDTFDKIWVSPEVILNI